MIARLFAVLLLLFSTMARAETIPATWSPGTGCGAANAYMSNGKYACTPSDVCNLNRVTSGGAGSELYNLTYISHTASNTTCQSTASYTEYTFPYTVVPPIPEGYICPDSTWTLSGNQCTRNTVTCNYPAGSQTPSADGLSCRCNLDMLNFPSAAGRPWFEGVGEMPNQLCDGGCMRNTGFGLGGGGKWSVEGGAFTGAKCDGNTPAPSTPKPDKKPPCAATEGVMTSSSGKVSCVPEGTPDARKPEVKKTESRETNPDGSTVDKTKTTTKDPATGATHTETVTTTPSGTTTSSTDSGGSGSTAKGSGDNSGNEPGQCAKEPDSPMCKSGTVKEKGKYGDQDAKVQEAKEQLTAKFNEIKGALSAAFESSAGGGGGSLPCPPPVSVLGKSFSLCIADYGDKLSVLGGIIVFAASIVAILLVVTA